MTVLPADPDVRMSIGMMVFQLGFALVLQVAQVFVWMYVFFFMLASRVVLQVVMPGELHYTWDDYRGQAELVKLLC